MLSPAGLLHILDGGGPGGPSGSNGGSSGWKFTTDISFTGLNNLSKRLVDLSKHVRTRCNKVNMVLKKSLIHRINSLLELSAAQNIMKNILQRQFQRFLHHSFEVRILTPSLSSSGLNMSHSEFNTRVRRNDGGEPEENTPSKKIKRK